MYLTAWQGPGQDLADRSRDMTGAEETMRRDLLDLANREHGVDRYRDGWMEKSCEHVPWDAKLARVGPF
jgi:hypothetical protein